MRAEVRLIGEALAELVGRLARLEKELHNRKPRTRGASVSVPVTPQLAQGVTVYHQKNPDVPQHVVGARFGVQQGRVSEILAGKRT